MALTIGEAQPARPASGAAALHTAIVVRSDVTGVWCARLGGDPSKPVGPCRGGAPGGARLPVTTVVLLATTQDGPWVAAVDEEATP